jgi:hypothetical protein
MDRALPAWAIDLIRDGVRPADLRAKGSRAVWRALVRTASSAQVRGQDQMEWEYLILQPQSLLGTQVRLRDAHHTRTARAVTNTLSKAWETAWEWRTRQPNAWSAQEVTQVAQERAKAIIDLVADPDAALTDAQRAVLNYAASETQRRGLLKVALPREDFLKATGLGLTALRTALKGLEKSGLLTLAEAGKPKGPNTTKARANLYALPSASMCRETRPVVPVAQTYGAPTDHQPGAPRHTYGAPNQEAIPGNLTDSTVKEPTMVRFIRYPDGRMVLEAEDPQVALMALQQGTAQVHVSEATKDDFPSNVTPIRITR